MKFLRRSLFVAASMAMLASCSSDELLVDDPNNVGGGGSDGDGVYMGLTIKMPGAAGSRSSTIEPGQSSDGNEEGQDYENNVEDVYIVMADPATNTYITGGVVQSNKLTPVPAQNAYKSVAKVQLSEISQYYDPNVTPTINQNRTVNIYVICNPTSEQLKVLDKVEFGNTEWINGIAEVSETPTEIASKAGKGRFVMTNASVATRQLPNTVKDWEYYKTEATAFDLSGVNQAGQDVEVDNSAENPNGARGAVRVERMAARFDFKDGSPSSTEANTYNVVFDSENEALIQIELTKMSLLNLSKTMYDFRRVSSNGLPSGAGYAICGAETAINYVVGPNAQEFYNATANGFNLNSNTGLYDFDFPAYFHNPYFTTTGRMDYSQWTHFQMLNDILKGDKDNYNGQYHIWHYAGENVIPGGTARQQYGLSTGVVFKGKMKGTEKLKETNLDLYNALNGVGISGTQDDPILYSFNGSLYFSWEEVRKAAIEASVEMKDGVPVKDEAGKITVNRSNSLYLAVFANGGMGTFTWGESNTKYTDPDDMAVAADSPDGRWTTWHNAVLTNAADKNTALANMRMAMTGVGFTLYQASTDNESGKGYYCYYFYMNRHNDNGDNVNMGPMEFAVVRNNVYKLAVTNIKQLGHPRTPENDPDKPTPDTPDESSDIYINVTCEVLPWVVRLNNIEF